MIPETSPRPIVMMPVDELRPYDKNAKIHSKEQVEKIANSIKRFGFRGYISIRENNEIINGHGRWLACKLLNYKSIPCVVETGLSEAEIRAFRLADNKVHEGEYDLNLLSEELFDLSQDESIDLNLFFSNKELEFSVLDLGEIDGDMVSDDLKGEMGAISGATSTLIDDADAKRVPTVKAFGFNDVSAGEARSIKRLMELAESSTDKKGGEALAAYIRDFLGL